MTKFKTFIKKHRVAVLVFCFLFLLSCSAFICYCNIDAFLSFPTSLYRRLISVHLCVFLMGDTFIALFDIWRDSKKKNKRISSENSD